MDIVFDYVLSPAKRKRMVDIKIVNIPRTSADKQVYMQSFCQAWIDSGGGSREQSKWMRYRLVRHLLKMLALTRFSCRAKQRVFIVCSRGGHLLKSSIPYLFEGEIVPMLWDCWPATWDVLERDLRLMKCRLCFVTASDVVREMSRRLPSVKFVHIPEGVDINDYQQGRPLVERSIDVYELGQKHKYYHKKLVDADLENQCNFVYNALNPEDGLSLVFADWRTFTSKVADSKIVISFPLSMRNPRRDGEVDTLTMRFWEGMLSRCIIVGHCPQELIDLIGYNPVIEADFVNPAAQITDLLNHLGNYQDFVDRNRSVALDYSPWRKRMDVVKKEIEDLYCR